MRFADADLARLDQTEEIEIETTAMAGDAHRTIIWVMVDGDDAFVRSVNGPTARWYREAVADPDVVVHVGGLRLPATAIAATDAHAVQRTSDALARKYAGHGASLGSMLQPDILDTTLRLEPR